MSVEESLTSEQIKCKEVVKVRCEPVEAEVKALRAADSMMKQRLAQAQAESRDVKDLESKLRSELQTKQKEVDSLTTRCQALEEDSQAQVRQMDEQHIKAILDLKAQHEAALDQLNIRRYEDLQTQIATLKAKQDSESKELAR